MMTEENDPETDGHVIKPLKRMNDKTMHSYVFLLILTLAVFLAGVYFGHLEDVIISIPIVLLLVIALFYDKRFIHIPPTMIFMVVIVMYFALASNMVEVGGGVLDIVTYTLIGMVTGMIGIAIAYMSLGKMPGFADEKPSLIALEAFSFGVMAYALWIVVSFYTNEIFDFEPLKIEIVVQRILFVSIGSLISSSLFFLGKRIRHTMIGFLSNNSDAIGIEEDEKKEVYALIASGESDNVEFKSTLRTNLQTGEKDKRMEKAVLKTIVAFLNSNGGTLLVGVSDDGKILGTDEESFDNRDKMNLHVTNLLSSQIGDEFIPFIRFRPVEFDDKTILRFTCKPTSSPVFLKDNNTELYFVRSGPSSIELTGIDLIKYVNNRSKSRKRKTAAAMPQKKD
ncbi:MAG: ATP-binding protein [Candidatus Methanomethylophilaceae archaeon]